MPLPIIRGWGRGGGNCERKPKEQSHKGVKKKLHENYIIKINFMLICYKKGVTTQHRAKN